ncbi:uncharacterized protein TNCV_5131131 [Trichonephila clavipes]|nr:uncharacterized protein TNCV_5131131 [Trichonephila clavipes]
MPRPVDVLETLQEVFWDGVQKPRHVSLDVRNIVKSLSFQCELESWEQEEVRNRIEIRRNKRYKIIHLKEEGYSLSQIAAAIPCGLSTVVRTLKSFSETNFIADRGRSGRPRKTSLREDRLLHRISLSNRKLNSSQILKHWTLTSNVSVCPRTVRGRLLEIGLRGCKTCPKPLLTEFQRKRRLTCGQGNIHYGLLKTGESPQCLKPTVKYPTKVMGCMSSHGVGRLHIVRGAVKAMDYIEILQNKLLYQLREIFLGISHGFFRTITPLVIVQSSPVRRTGIPASIYTAGQLLRTDNTIIHSNHKMKGSKVWKIRISAGY